MGSRPSEIELALDFRRSAATAVGCRSLSLSVAVEPVGDRLAERIEPLVHRVAAKLLDMGGHDRRVA
jgi:hypothetical protein